MKWFEILPKWLFAGTFLFLVLLIFYLAISGVQFHYKDKFGFIKPSPDIPLPQLAGTIIPWDPIHRSANGTATGKTREIPSGWSVCDGTNGSPNLENNFLMGSIAKINAGKHGGDNTINDSETHNHGGNATDLSYQRGRINWDRRRGIPDDQYSHKHSISSDGNHNHGGDKRPAYYSVLFLCANG